jgi:hypothetical protein
VSSDDVTARARFISVGGNGFIGFEVQVALDGKPDLTADGAKLSEANVAESLGPSMALALRARLRRFNTALPF